MHINANILLLAVNEMQTHCFTVFIDMTTRPAVDFDYLLRRESFGSLLDKFTHSGEMRISF